MGMAKARYIGIALLALWAWLAMAADVSRADDSTYCITCQNPDRVYACKVQTPKKNPGEKALRLYCIGRLAVEGGHKSCGSARYDAKTCKGKLKRYTYKGPEISPALQSAIEKRLQKKNNAAQSANQKTAPDEAPKQDTLVDLTSRTLKSTREGAGKAVGGAIRGTGRVVGGAAKGTGRAVGGAARSTGQAVGGAIRSTGQAVGGAAKYTYNCVFSFFRNCSGSDEPAAEEASEDSEALR
jgi:hypothetical protein